MRWAAPATRRARRIGRHVAGMIERRFRRDFASLDSIVGFVNEFLGARGVGPDRAHDVHLVIEELFTNMVKYGGESREDIEIGLDWGAPVLTVRIRDFDVDPFDVTIPPPAGPALVERPGGLGLRFVRRVADRLAYRWADRVSTITLTKRLGA